MFCSIIEGQIKIYNKYFSSVCEYRGYWEQQRSSNSRQRNQCSSHPPTGWLISFIEVSRNFLIKGFVVASCHCCPNFEAFPENTHSSCDHGTGKHIKYFDNPGISCKVLLVTVLVLAVRSYSEIKVSVGKSYNSWFKKSKNISGVFCKFYIKSEESKRFVDPFLPIHIIQL